MFPQKEPCSNAEKLKLQPERITQSRQWKLADRSFPTYDRKHGS
jgi:hypothetical protein